MTLCREIALHMSHGLASGDKALEDRSLQPFAPLERTACPPILGTNTVTDVGGACPGWYALKVRTRSETPVSRKLWETGFEAYSPTYLERRRYSDRIKPVPTAAFPGYLFCRFDLRKKQAILRTAGVEYIVSVEGRPAAIPSREIEDLRRAMDEGAIPAAGPLQIGQKVRVEYGPLTGIEGLLVGAKKRHLAVSVTLLGRSVSVEIDPDRLTPVR